MCYPQQSLCRNLAVCVVSYHIVVRTPIHDMGVRYIYIFYDIFIFQIYTTLHIHVLSFFFRFFLKFRNSKLSRGLSEGTPRSSLVKTEFPESQLHHMTSELP